MPSQSNRTARAIVYAALALLTILVAAVIFRQWAPGQQSGSSPVGADHGTPIDEQMAMLGIDKRGDANSDSATLPNKAAVTSHVRASKEPHTEAEPGRASAQQMRDRVAVKGGMPLGLSRHQLCTRMERLAEAVMKGRQQGLPMSAAIGNAQGNVLAEKIVSGAYKEDRQISEKWQSRMVEDYKISVYRQCYENIPGE